MNIETANRLLQYRKKLGLSQEELAERVGVSRQAVSKWERAEAAPDTDNLIALSRVYGVTIDELLTGGSDNAEQASDSPSDEPGEKEQSYDGGFNVNSEGERVHIGFDGIHIHDKHGTKVDIDRRGVFVNENGEQKVYTDADGHIHKSAEVIAEEQKNRSFWRVFPYPVLTVIAYILFGAFNVMGGWAYGWIVFLTIPLYYTLVDAIIKRKSVHFCYPVLVAMIFLILGFGWSWWHPGWVIFLTIPLFYAIAGHK